MGSLEDLWYGSVNPYENRMEKSSRVRNILTLLTKNEKALKDALSDEQKEQFEKLQDCQEELTDLLECSAFAEGFCQAVKIMAEVMSSMDIPSVDD